MPRAPARQTATSRCRLPRASSRRSRLPGCTPRPRAAPGRRAPASAGGGCGTPHPPPRPPGAARRLYALSVVAATGPARRRLRARAIAVVAPESSADDGDEDSRSRLPGRHERGGFRDARRRRRIVRDALERRTRARKLRRGHAASGVRRARRVRRVQGAREVHAPHDGHLDVRPRAEHGGHRGSGHGVALELAAMTPGASSWITPRTSSRRV